MIRLTVGLCVGNPHTAYLEYQRTVTKNHECHRRSEIGVRSPETRKTTPDRERETKHTQTLAQLVCAHPSEGIKSALRADDRFLHLLCSGMYCRL